MKNHLAFATTSTAPQVSVRLQSPGRTAYLERHSIHLAIRPTFGNAVKNRLRVWHEFLVQCSQLVASQCLGQAVSHSASQAEPCRSPGFFPLDRGQFDRARRAWVGGPNPPDRCKVDSKLYFLADGNGPPLNVILTGANCYDSMQLLPMLDGMVAIAGRRERPLKRPRHVQTDRNYECKRYRCPAASGPPLTYAL